MQQIALLVVLLITFGFISVRQVSAQIRINEVLPNPSGSSQEPSEFIELFNTEENEVDISGWTIEDALGSVIVFIISDSVIGGRSFATFRREQTNITLNNTGDGVVLKNTIGEVIDEMTFEQSSEDVSWALYPDGVGNFLSNMIPSENTPNSAPPTPTLANTPTATVIPTSTKIPTPTKTPRPTNTKTPTKTPTLGKNPTVAEIKASTGTRSPLSPIQDQNTENENSSDSATLGIEDVSENSKANPSREKSIVDEVQTLGVTNSKGGIAVIVGGILFLSACGILIFQKFRHIFLK